MARTNKGYQGQRHANQGSGRFIGAKVGSGILPKKTTEKPFHLCGRNTTLRRIACTGRVAWRWEQNYSGGRRTAME